MSFCSTCFEATLKSCPDFINISAGLAADAEYYWVIRRGNKVRQKLVTTNAEGVLSIDATDFPDGYFNAFSPWTELQIREGANYLNVVTLSINGEDYDCINLSFSDIEGDEGANNSVYSSTISDISTLDVSHLLLNFNLSGPVDITLTIEKIIDTEDSFIDWGDGITEVVPADFIISKVHSYTAAGMFKAKIYPSNGVTSPTAPAVNNIKTVNLVVVPSPTGQAFLSVGASLSRANFLTVFHANGFAIPTFPLLPQGSNDKVRDVSLKSNQLSGATISTILRQLDEINWPVGFVDVSLNPGSGLLNGEGLAAKASLIAKGWTLYI